MNKCSVCIRDDVEAINADILSKKYTNQQLIQKYGLSVGTFNRHKQHTLQQLQSAQDPTEIAKQTSATMAKLAQLGKRADGIYKKAERSNDSRNQLNALKELREIVTLIAKITGELNTQQQVIHNHLHVSPEWVSMRSKILLALDPYPDARAAIITVLEKNDDDQ